jgi:hypothetical protein
VRDGGCGPLTTHSVYRWSLPITRSPEKPSVSLGDDQDTWQEKQLQSAHLRRRFHATLNT